MSRQVLDSSEKRTLIKYELFASIKYIIMQQDLFFQEMEQDFIE
jgi:hypothetical protein